MRRLFEVVAAISAVAFAQIAAAADLPVKAPVVPVVYNWTGFYAGGNAGYSWGDAHTDHNGTATTVSFPAVLPIANDFSFAASSTQRLEGFIGGGQLGYNYQFRPNWVVGFEADIQGSAERATGIFSDPISGPVCISAQNPPPVCTGTVPLSGTATTSYQAKIEWFGTVRGRLGTTFSDDLIMLYGTGGLAYGEVKLSANTAINANPLGFGFSFAGNTQYSGSETRLGWTAGGGVEGKFSRASNWTWKIEYLYVDLGSLNIAGPFSAAPNAPGFGSGFSPLTGTVAARTHFTDNILRVGFNYGFGAPLVAAKY